MFLNTLDLHLVRCSILSTYRLMTPTDVNKPIPMNRQTLSLIRDLVLPAGSTPLIANRSNQSTAFLVGPDVYRIFKFNLAGHNSVLMDRMVEFLLPWWKVYCLLERAHSRQVSLHTGRGSLVEHQSHAEQVPFAGHTVNFAFMKTIISRYC